MRASGRSRYAVRAMIDLALRGSAAPVALADIAHRQHVSLSHLEQLFSLLRAAGLVRSTRGAGGGFNLGMEAEAISVAAIVGAVETGAAGSDVEGGRAGLVSGLSQRMVAVMLGHLEGISLASLAAGQSEAAIFVAARPRFSVTAPQARVRHVSASVPNSVFELGRVSATAPEPPLVRGSRLPRLPGRGALAGRR